MSFVCFDHDLPQLLSGKIDMLGLVRLMSTRPAQLLNIGAGTLRPGAEADFVLIDENAEYVFGKTLSRSRNTPWLGKKLKGRVVETFVGGKSVHRV